MAGSLKPCGKCSRHVRTHERACPFCGSALALSEPIEEFRLLSRFDRSTMVALGAVLSAAGIAFGCREAPVAIYGAPPATPEQVQPVPSSPPPADAPAPVTSTVLAPQPSPATLPATPAAPGASAAANTTPSSRPAPVRPKNNPGPFAPVAAYGAPPRPGMSPDIEPRKPDSK